MNKILTNVISSNHPFHPCHPLQKKEKKFQSKLVHYFWNSIDGKKKFELIRKVANSVT